MKGRGHCWYGQTVLHTTDDCEKEGRSMAEAVEAVKGRGNEVYILSTISQVSDEPREIT